jgi:hypothetical protein
VVYDFCGRKVYLAVKPPEGLRDPLAGSTVNDFSPHWSRPMPEGEPGRGWLPPLLHHGLLNRSPHCLGGKVSNECPRAPSTGS